MAGAGKKPGGYSSLVRPEAVKTPFGGVPAPRGRKAQKSEEELLPGRKALNQLAKPDTNIQEFGKLTPVGAGALDEDFLTTAHKANQKLGW